MNANDSPWFPFHVLAWQSSRRVQAMSLAERGLYLELLLRQWDKGTVAATADACAADLGLDAELVRGLWPRVAACFHHRPGVRMVNERLDAERKIRVAYLREQRRRGKLGGEARAKKRDIEKPPPSTGLASAKPVQYSTDSTEQDSTSTVQDRTVQDSTEKKDQRASRAVFTQAELENRKRARAAAEPTLNGNGPILVKLAHDILNAASPDTDPSEIAERMKARAADLRIDYGNHPDVRTDAITHAIEVARLQRQAREHAPSAATSGGFVSLGVIAGRDK